MSTPGAVCRSALVLCFTPCVAFKLVLLPSCFWYQRPGLRACPRLCVRATAALHCAGGGIFLSSRIYLLMGDAGERLPAFTHTRVCGLVSPLLHPPLTPRPLLYLTPRSLPRSIFVNLFPHREAASLCPPQAVAATRRLLFPHFLLKMVV